jgi:hypothetical protein
VHLVVRPDFYGEKTISIRRNTNAQPIMQANGKLFNTAKLKIPIIFFNNELYIRSVGYRFILEL